MKVVKYFSDVLIEDRLRSIIMVSLFSRRSQSDIILAYYVINNDFETNIYRFSFLWKQSFVRKTSENLINEVEQFHFRESFLSPVGELL